MRSPQSALATPSTRSDPLPILDALCLDRGCSITRHSILSNLFGFLSGVATSPLFGAHSVLAAESCARRNLLLLPHRRALTRCQFSMRFASTAAAQSPAIQFCPIYLGSCPEWLRHPCSVPTLFLLQSHALAAICSCYPIDAL